MYKSINQATKKVPLTQKEPAKNQVKNNAGGYSYQVADLEQVKRFLILGTTGGSHYLSEKDLLKQNLDSIKAAVEQNPAGVLSLVVDVADNARASNNEASLYVLACLVSLKKEIKAVSKAGRAYTVVESTDIAKQAMLIIPKVARTFTHISHFIEYIKKGKLRGFGRGFQRSLANAFYNQKSVEDLVFSLIKYQSRDEFTQGDIYRLVMPTKFDLPAENLQARVDLYNYIFYRKDKAIEPSHPRLLAARKLLKVTNSSEALTLMRDYKLPMESVPTTVRDASIYAQALNTNGLEWLCRNLGNLSEKGLTEPFSKEGVLDQIKEKLQNEDLIKKSRLHPVSIMKAMHQYKQGHGDKSDKTWSVNANVLQWLTDAFYRSFKYVEPSGKRILLAVDVSGSMSHGQVTGINGMEVMEAAAIMAMAIARTEPNHYTIGFDYAGYSPYAHRTTKVSAGVYEIPISPEQRLDDIQATLKKFGGGGTDCALPFMYAADRNWEVDLFVCLTDSETWAGRANVMDALNTYRAKSGIRSKAVNVAMTANRTTNLDATDVRTLEVVGFDTTVPQLISEFAKL